MLSYAQMSITRESLGFVLAIDNCGRGCSHCPAHGMRRKMEMAPFDDLQRRLKLAGVALANTDVIEQRTIHGWRIGDLLDYKDSSSGSEKTVIDLAESWYSDLGQPLYTVTNGTLGSDWRRKALADLASEPELSSQVKLTVTPFDPRFYHKNYVDNMAHDVATLWPLAQYPSQRPEGAGQPRFRINAKTSLANKDQLVDQLGAIIEKSGAPIDLHAALDGKSDYLKIKPVYDLRVSEDQVRPLGAVSLGGSLEERIKPETIRSQNQLGIRPDGRAFEVDLWAFSETDLTHPDGSPLTFDDWFDGKA